MSDDRPTHRGAEENEADAEALATEGPRSMTGIPATAATPGAPRSGQAFRTVLLEMADPIVNRIRSELPSYDGPAGGRRHQLMSIAADAALRAYLDTTPKRESAQRKVDELFRRMGWGEAQDGSTVENVEAALRLASRAAWDYLADYAVDQDFAAQTLRDVTNELLAYTEHLRSELLAGHAMGLRNPKQQRGSARTQLWELFQNTTTGRTSPLAPLGVDPDELAALALSAQWPVPSRVVLLAVTFHGDPPDVPNRPELLVRLHGNRLQVISPADEAEGLADLLQRSGSDRRVVLSWPVPAEEAGSALLWTSRALDLIQLGAIAPTAVVRCMDHATQLWLHAEPSMRRRLCQNLLEPLLAEAPNSREILTETLLVWLETRDSAPAIAARLDVHPQTVRYRWRRINELFGEVLRDPEFVVQLTLVLKASVPMWKGGDQSDFELFRDTRDAE